MATTSRFTSSFQDVKTLAHTIRSKSSSNASTTTMTLLPNRAPVSDDDVHQYLDSAICILSRASNHSYFDHDIIDRRVDQLQDKVETGFNKIDKQFTYVHKRFDKVEDSIGAVKEDVKTLKGDVKTLKTLKEEVKALRTDINRQFQDNLAFQRNRLARVLDAEIEQVPSFVKCEDGETRAEVAADFPTTVWQFWLLKTRSKILYYSSTNTPSTPFISHVWLSLLTVIIVPALQRLAKHYSVKGWQDWKMMQDGNLESTQYHCIDDAVAAHPARCHRALAVKWGLEYGQLQRLEAQDTPRNAQKRKIDSESGERRVRPKRSSDSEISILPTDGQTVIIRRRTMEDAMVPVTTSLGEVIEEYGCSGSGTAEEGHIRWSDSSTRAHRHRLRAVVGLDPPELDERTFRDRRTVTDEDHAK